MKQKMKQKLVLIEWVDSAQPLPGWRFLNDLPSLAVVHCKSVGWLVGASKAVRMLAPNLGDVVAQGDAQASGFIRIPVASIIRQVALREVE